LHQAYHSSGTVKGAGDGLLASAPRASKIATGAGPRHSKLSEPKINQLLTKLVYLEIGHAGRVCWLSGQPLA